jgi:hypothetical protein
MNTNNIHKENNQRKRCRASDAKKHMRLIHPEYFGQSTKCYRTRRPLQLLLVLVLDICEVFKGGSERLS